MCPLPAGLLQNDVLLHLRLYPDGMTSEALNRNYIKEKSGRTSYVLVT
jgi:hypothetical protein